MGLWFGSKSENEPISSKETPIGPLNVTKTSEDPVYVVTVFTSSTELKMTAFDEYLWVQKY